MRIAHISPHIGGGVGSVLLDFFSLSKNFGIVNDLFCLDRCKTNFEELTGVNIRLDGLAYDSDPVFFDILSSCDIVLVHYWNHPLMARFLFGAHLPPCRLLVWSHNSGLYEPHIIPTNISRMAQKLLFSSRCSIHAPNLELKNQDEMNRFGVVHSTRSLEVFNGISYSQNSKQHTGKILLYVGTVSKAKMHAESAKIFSELSRLGYTIRIVGGPEHQALKAEVAMLGGSVEVFGPVTDVVEFYKDADVFIYPLSAEHYGTGEQVILEAMAAGLPVVAFNNPSEEAILYDGGGVLVSTSDQFVVKVTELLNNLDYQRQLSKVASMRISNDFDVNIMTEKMIQYFVELIDVEKIAHIMPTSENGSVNELALYALNSFFDESLFDEIIKNPECAVDIVYKKIEADICKSSDMSRWLCDTKSSPFHYYSYYPESKDLAQLTDKLLHIDIC